MREFENALSDYIRDFANGGAIRHFVELGFGVSEIHNELDYPMSIELVGEAVWKEYVALKIVCLEEAHTDQDYIEKTSYVKDYNKYGKTSLRKVVTREEVGDRKYIACDFGKRIYKNNREFISRLNNIPEVEAKMIRDLPWPLEIVYIDCDSSLGAAVKSLNEEIKLHEDRAKES